MPHLIIGDKAVPIAALILDKDGTLHRFDSFWVPLVEARLAALTDAVAHPADSLRRPFGITAAGTVRPDGLLAQGTRAEAPAVATAWLHDRGLGWMAAREAAQSAFDRADAQAQPEKRLEPIAGLRPWLESWIAAGGRCAIASTASRRDIDTALSVLAIRPFFPFCLGGDEVQAPKPDPEAVRRLCGQLQVGPEAVAVVGDGLNDMLMGRAAGVGATIGVLSGVDTAATLGPHADLLLPDLTQLRWRGVDINS
ncbi:MAG: HAD family hydrolase [Candidatus Sericytochromatia bacterium]|nr:HAD family hydrolase [Candidatus Sericytochromatia bacterium]